MWSATVSLCCAGFAPQADTQTDQPAPGQQATQAPTAGTQFDTAAAASAVLHLAAPPAAEVPDAAAPSAPEEPDVQPSPSHVVIPAMGCALDAAKSAPTDAGDATNAGPVAVSGSAGAATTAGECNPAEDGTPAGTGMRQVVHVAATPVTPARRLQRTSGGVDPLCSRVSPTQRHGSRARTPGTSGRCARNCDCR